MEKELTTDKKCKNCANYLTHYIKSENRFRVIPDGHCTSRTPGGRFRKTDKVCECYTERDLVAEKEQQLKSAVEYLEFIAGNIDQLTQILRMLTDENE